MTTAVVSANQPGQQPQQGAVGPQSPEARASLLLANVRDAVVVTDLNGVITYWNGAAEKIFGWTADEIQGRNYADRSAGNPACMSIAERIAAVAAGEAAWNGEYVDSRKDGTPIWLDAHVALLSDHNGVPIGTLVTSRDITARKRAEERLRESEARFRLLFDSNPIGVVQGDLTEGRILHANDAFLQVVGRTREELAAGRINWVQLTPPEWLRVDIEAVERSKYTGTSPPYEKEYIRPDGSRVPVLVGFTREGVDRAIAFVLDISQSKQQEAQLRESEERFRLLADNISQFAWMADETGHIFWYNQRWFDYTGATLDEMQGWGWQKVHHPAHVQRVVDKLRACIQAGQEWEDTFPLRRKDGQYRWFLSRAMPVRDGQGRVVRWFGTNTDISERIAAEERFRAAFDQAAVGMAHLAPDGRWLRVNQRLCDITGYSREEMLLRTFQDITYPDDLPADLEQAARLIAGEISSYSMEKRYIRKDGRITWINLFVIAVRDEQGSLAYFLSVIEDINAGKAAEEERDRQRRQFEAVVEAVQDGIAVCDMAGQLVYVNPAEARINGYDRVEDMLRDLEYYSELYELTQDGRLVPPGEWPISRAMRGESFTELQVHGRRKDTGQEWEFSFSGAPILDESGRQVLAVVVTRDITETRQAQIRLLESEQRYRELLEVSPHAVFINLHGRFAYANKAALEMFGAASIGELQEKQVLDLIHPAYRAAAEERMAAVLQTGKASIPMQQEWVRLDGRSLLVEKRDAPCTWGGEPALQMVLNDITEIADLNKRLHRAIFEASHRIKNHLQVLAATADMAVLDNGDVVPADQVQRLTTQIKLLAQIHDILTLETKGDAEVQLLSAESLLSRVTSVLPCPNEQCHVTLEVGELLVPVKLASTLALAVNELVSNSWKHGGRHVDVVLRATEGRACLVVRDDGPGFPSGFDPDKAADTGLELIRTFGRYDLKGEVVFANLPGQGAEVRIEFPLPTES